MAKNILLTGRPGVGKTTVITRLAEELREKQIAGFTTEEIRQGGERRGFRLQTFSDQHAIMAHVRLMGSARVGRYRVDVEAIDRLVLPELSRPCDLYLIDEIGKMECFSRKFVEATRTVLNADTPLVATIAMKGPGFIAEVKDRGDVEIIEVTPANRNGLPMELAQRVSTLLGER